MFYHIYMSASKSRGPWNCFRLILVVLVLSITFKPTLGEGGEKKPTLEETEWAKKCPRGGSDSDAYFCMLIGGRVGRRRYQDPRVKETFFFLKKGGEGSEESPDKRGREREMPNAASQHRKHHRRRKTTRKKGISLTCIIPHLPHSS